MRGKFALEVEEKEKALNSVQIEGREYGTDYSYKMIERYDLVKKIEEGIPLSSYLQDYPARDISSEFQVCGVRTRVGSW